MLFFGSHWKHIQSHTFEEVGHQFIKFKSKNYSHVKLFLHFTVIFEWNNTDDEELKNKSTTVLSTGSPYQNNEGPLQRDEVKATFNKDDQSDSSCK